MNLKNLFSKKKDAGTDLYAKSVNSLGIDTITKEKMCEMVKKRDKIVEQEFSRGYNLIKKYPRSVSILGSAKLKEDNKYYQQAKTLAEKIVQELKYAVVTGGGPGIMEAANRGAYEGGGVSLGFTIKLPDEQSTNEYLTEHVEFENLFSRTTLIFFSAETYVYFPGGFGTIDEFFEIVTLMETGKLPRVPVILVGKEFWEPILKLIKDELYEKFHTIKFEDLSIYKIVDDNDEIIKIIKNAPFN